MQAFEEAELSRKRYEAINAFCEESIREMEIQRLEFERNVAQFLSERQEVIDKIVLDTSLLKENGTLNDYETKQTLEKGQAALAKL